jgi:D-tyrosyl-tRNA(Tyr) deacylase
LRALIQRVNRAHVSIQGKVVGSIAHGLVLFLGIGLHDTTQDASYLVQRLLNLRIFSDGEGKFDRSSIEVAASLLVISQFTLYADTRKGRRPSFMGAASSAEAEILFDQTVELLRQENVTVVTGKFGAHMKVDLQNDGPVTIWIDSAERLRPRRTPKDN